MESIEALGDASARFLAHQTERLLARVRSMLGDSARRACDSLDYLQEAWVDFLRSGDARGLEDEDALVRRFCAIARNNVRDACRKRRDLSFESVCGQNLDEDQLALEQSSTSSRIARSEAVARLREATRALPNELRTIVELRALEGESFVDIARKLGRREDAVRKGYNRALIELTRRLGRT